MNWVHPFIEIAPKRYTVEPFKRITQLKIVQNNAHEELLSVFLRRGVVRYSDTKQKQVHKPSEDMSRYQLVEPRDVVLNNQQAWRGSVGVSKYRGIISPAYYVLTLVKDINAQYFNYLIQDYTTVGQFYVASRGVGSIQRNIYLPELRNVVVCLPPRGEQDQIVRWLDWQTSRISQYTHAKKCEIECLQELRKAIISEAVTKGLNPHVKMKKATTYFEHDIPKHWNEVKIKRVLTPLNRSYDSDAEMLICSNRGTVFPRGDSKMGLVSDKETFYQGVKSGDLLIHGMDTWHGAIAISGLDGKCTGVVHVCESTQSKSYICYYLQMLAYRKLYKAITNGVRQNTSDFRSWDKAGNIEIALPPIDEQTAISAYLDEQCAAINELIAKLTREIELVGEYKASIISEAVTGKIDLRNVEIPDFEPMDEPENDTEEGIDDEDD